MQIPKYWRRETVTGKGTQGEDIVMTRWGWSCASADDAATQARAAATAAVERFRAGQLPDWYWYAERPLREEILEDNDDQAAPFAITRNSRGCEILNAANAFFIDIDLPASPSPGIFSLLRSKLTGKQLPNPGQTAYESAVQRIRDYVSANPGWGVRVYRTRAGLRALVTHALFDPTAGSTVDVLRQLGSDPLYARLCRAQESFRARLTPKPWRCSCPNLRDPYPRDDAAAQTRFVKWVENYEQHSAGYATCHFITAVGNPEVLPALQPIVAQHDRRTRADSDLQLA